MFHEKLKKIAGKYDSVLAFSKIVGMSHVMLGHALKGKRNLSQISWKKILMNSEGMSSKEANDQIAEWQMEEASQKLGHNGKEIADRIRAAVEEQGVNKTKLGEILGTHPNNTDEAKELKCDQFFQALEEGNINFYAMEAISAYLRKSVSYFLGRKYYPELGREDVHHEPKKLSKLVGRTVTFDDLVKVPFVGRVSCGHLKEVELINDEYRHVHKDSLRRGKDFIVLEADGLSMIEAGILEGDEVLVCRDAEPMNGEICIFSLRGDLVMGYLFRDEKYVEIKKANRDFPPIRIDDPDFSIEGVALEKKTILNRRLRI